MVLDMEKKQEKDDILHFTRVYYYGLGKNFIQERFIERK